MENYVAQGITILIAAIAAYIGYRIGYKNGMRDALINIGVHMERKNIADRRAKQITKYKAKLKRR